MEAFSLVASDFWTPLYFLWHKDPVDSAWLWTFPQAVCVHHWFSQLLFISINRILINWYLLPSFHLSLGDSLSQTDGASVSCQCLCITFLKGTQALQIMSFSINTFQMFFLNTNTLVCLFSVLWAVRIFQGKSCSLTGWGGPRSQISPTIHSICGASWRIALAKNSRRSQCL